MERVYLTGSEDVARASFQIDAAADKMERAASSIDSTLFRFGLKLEDVLYQFNEFASRLEKAMRDEKRGLPMVALVGEWLEVTDTPR